MPVFDGLCRRSKPESLGLTLHSEKSNGERVYRVTDAGAKPQAAWSSYQVSSKAVLWTDPI
jgi:hypothetical protein